MIMMTKWYSGPGGPRASWHLSYRSGKTSPRKLVPTGDRTWASCVIDAHATACSTAVDAISKWMTLNLFCLNSLRDVTCLMNLISLSIWWPFSPAMCGYYWLIYLKKCYNYMLCPRVPLNTILSFIFGKLRGIWSKIKYFNFSGLIVQL